MTRQAILLGSMLGLCACFSVVGEEYQQPDLQLPPQYSQPLPSITETGSTDPDYAFWWQGFDDREMERLVTDILAANLTVAAAQARIDEARALASAIAGFDDPTLDAGAAADGRAQIFGDADDDAEAGITGSLLFGWSPDLFGGQQRREEAAAAALQNRIDDRGDIQRLLVADTVRLYLGLKRSHSQLDLVEQSLSLQEQILQLVRQRFEVGLAAQFDVSRAEAQRARTRSQIAPLRGDIAETRAILAALSGNYAIAIETADEPDGMVLPAYSDRLLSGVPADLIRNRADIRVAEANLIQTVAETGIAEADFYPALQIPGALSLSSSGYGTGSIVESLIATLAASLNIPLFDGGVRSGNLAAAEARAREALFLYRQSVVDAVRDVETAIARIDAAILERDDLRLAERASAEAFEQSENLYAEGLTDFLDVLDAESTLLDTRQDLADAEIDISLAVADFYTAIGAPVSPITIN